MRRKTPKDAATRPLSGESDVVGGDPYELRIARPANGDWSIDRVEADGAKVRVAGEDLAGWRVCIKTPDSSAVTWRVVMRDQ